jgi:hypothetical protein
MDPTTENPEDLYNEYGGESYRRAAAKGDKSHAEV